MNAEVYIGNESVGTLAGTTLTLFPPWNALGISNVKIRLRLESIPEVETRITSWNSATQVDGAVIIGGVKFHEFPVKEVEETTTFISKLQLENIRLGPFEVLVHAINKSLKELHINAKSEITQSPFGITIRVQKWSVKTVESELQNV